LAECIRLYNEKHKTNHIIDFLPKFHPELNPIERYWAALKNLLREFPAGTAAKHRIALKKALTDGVKREQFGRYVRKSLRVADAYRLGCSYTLADFAARKYKSHRGMPSNETLESITKALAEKLGVSAAALLPTPLPDVVAFAAPAAVVQAGSDARPDANAIAVPAAVPAAGVAAADVDQIHEEDMEEDERQQIIANKPSDRDELRSWHLARRLQNQHALSSSVVSYREVLPNPAPNGERRSSRKRKERA
jgi:hypothetical protein